MKRFVVSLGLGSLFLILNLDSTLSLRADTPFRNAAVVSSQQPTVRWHESLEAGWQDARRQNLPMIVFITSEECHYCDAMKRDTWGDESVRRRIAKEFVAIELKPSRNAEALRRVDVKMFPTTLIGLPEGRIIAHRTGYQSAAAIQQLMNEAEQPVR